MKTLFYALILFLLFSSRSRAQSQYIFDKIPIDTTKWVATDTLFVDFSNDGIIDIILVFDKYKALYRPENVQTPVLFYLGIKNNSFVYFDKSEKLIYLPYFEIKTLNKMLIITQKGMHEDRNIYTSYLKYENGAMIVFKEVIVKVSKKSKINEETGDVNVISTKIDTIYNKANNIKIDKYDFMQFMQKFNK